jgi:hypothetical protein
VALPASSKEHLRKFTKRVFLVVHAHGYERCLGGCVTRRQKEAAKGLHRSSAHAAGSYANRARTRYGSDSTHCRTGTSGITASTSQAAVSTIRAAPRDGQQPRPLHEKATTSTFCRGGLEPLFAMTPGPVALAAARRWCSAAHLLLEAQVADAELALAEASLAVGEVELPGADQRLAAAGDKGITLPKILQVQREAPETILELLGEQPGLAFLEIARFLGKSESAVKRAVRKLRESGRLQRIGPDKGGHWKVIQ